MEYYSHKSIRKLVKALLETFSDIQVERTDENGNILARQPIPITFGSSDRTTILRKHDLEQIVSGNYNVLPRAGLSVVSMLKAPERNTNRLNPILNTPNPLGPSDYSLNCVAYDMTFELTFMSKTMTDATVILETILPRFNPALNIRYKELDIDIEETSIPLLLDTIEIQPSTEYAENDIRIITTTFYVRAKINVYHPITNIEIIEKVKMNFSAWNEQKVVFEDRTIEYPIQSNP